MTGWRSGRVIRGFLIVAVSGVVSAVAFSAHAQERTFVRSISVTGQCLRSVIPDRGSITITADTLDKNLQAAAKKTTESYENLKKAVQKLSLKNVELQTSEYNVQEVKEWEKDKSVFKGYRARMGLEITTSEISRLGEVIAIAGNQQIKEVGQLRSFLSEEKNREERETCLEEAISHAQTKAGKMAKAAGAKLGRVLQLKEEGTSAPEPPRPVYMAKSMRMADTQEMAAPSVEAGNQKLSQTVEAIYSLE